MKRQFYFSLPAVVIILAGLIGGLFAQNIQDSSLLTIDRIFASGEFRGDRFSQARWIENGDAYTMLEPAENQNTGRDIVKYETKSGKRSVLVSAGELIPRRGENPLGIADYHWSGNKEMLLIFTNTRRVWRYNTRGDYWVLNLKTKSLKQLGTSLPPSSLMFAKFSPFRWSPDGKTIAYWQIDASGIKDFLMINNTDSLYSFTIPVEYPKVGEDPSSARIGVIGAEGGETKWMQIPGDPKQHYLVRMLWDGNSKDFLVQQLNRKQNTNKVWLCKSGSGWAANVYTDRDDAWVDLVEDWLWIDGDKYYTWLSEKDGWRHLYLVSKTGDEEKLITKGNYDVIGIDDIDGKSGYAYFTASPDNPTQRYLYRIKLDGSGKAQRITPEDETGTHQYQIAPGGKFAFHTWSDINTPPVTELVSLPKHKTIRVLVDNQRLKKAIAKLNLSPAEFFSVTTGDSVTMEGFMVKPPDFDPEKKYPVLFYVYGEPWRQTARDAWGAVILWMEMLSQKGYIILSLDNRGTPAPKGRAWRKSIYRKIGVINSRDQAMAAKKIIQWPFIDSTRIAVWGWSGGGSMTLNLMFRYPDIYSTGMAVAAVSNQFYYDNIYQERYMGLKSENPEDFIEGSPITYAKNLEGNLLIVHGTGDDNVHYQNAEALINELIKNNKLFQMMPYPNRSHGIYEGENTTRHLFTLLTDYLLTHVEPGGK